MPFLQHFIIEGKHLGPASRDSTWVHAERQVPYSYLFYCPCCGEVWGKFPVTTLSGQESPWQSLARCCRKHSRSSYDIPGAITLNWDEGFSTSLPPEVVAWEFIRHLDTVRE